MTTNTTTSSMNPEVAELLQELNLLEQKIRQEIFKKVFNEEIPKSNTDDIYGFALEAARNCAAQEMFPDRPDLKGSGLSAAIQERAMDEIIAETGNVDTEKVRTRKLDYMIAENNICNWLCKEYNRKLEEAREAFFTQNAEGMKYMEKAQAISDRLMKEGRANLKAKLGELKSAEYAGRKIYQTRCCAEGMPYHGILCIPGVILTCNGCRRQSQMSLDLVTWMDCDENYDICENCILFKCRYCDGPCCCEIR